MKVRCLTYFDITTTGVKNHFKQSRIPFTDSAGNKINNADAWNRARNQQRNWETINQLISLRALPIDITEPVKTSHNGRHAWVFEFVIEQQGAVTADNNPIGALINDSNMIPMLTGLDETAMTDQLLIPNANIFFDVVALNIL
jgi:hypothetical protein